MKKQYLSSLLAKAGYIVEIGSFDHVDVDPSGSGGHAASKTLIDDLGLGAADGS